MLSWKPFAERIKTTSSHTRFATWRVSNIKIGNWRDGEQESK